jgi:hypothetical protein
MMIRGAIFVVGLGVLGAATFATAQENLEAGKSGAQLYAADCAACHKISDGAAKAHGIVLLESFLREHYAASRQSAAIIADYLRTIGNKGGRLPRQAGRDGVVKPKNNKSQPQRLGEGRPKNINETEQTSAKNPEVKKGTDTAKPDQPSPSGNGSENAKPAQPN